MDKPKVSNNQKTNKICSVPNCGRGGRIVRTWCSKHYDRWLAHGSPDIVLRPQDSSPEERFWRYVNKTETCWLWTGGTNSCGYGSFGVAYTQYGAHRYSYFLAHGYMPSKFVLHSCDTPLCVNPAHLREGTNLDNMRDRDERNRQAKGEKIHTSKLTAPDVRSIKVLLAQGVLHRIIANKFGVKENTIFHIYSGRTWTHI